MARHDFQNPVTGEICWLVVDETPAGEHGVEHPDCTELAAVSRHLDAFFCTTCQRGGRISGAWAMELWRAGATYEGGA